MKYSVMQQGDKTRFSIGSRVFTLETLDGTGDPEETKQVREFIAKSLHEGLKELTES